MSFNVPSKRIRPLSIKIIRSVIASISCISWVVKIIVVLFFLFSSEINFLTVNFERASSPIVGSSKKRILGLCKSEAAISQVPESGVRIPHSTFMVELFPAPFGPM